LKITGTSCALYVAKASGTTLRASNITNQVGYFQEITGGNRKYRGNLAKLDQASRNPCLFESIDWNVYRIINLAPFQFTDLIFLDFGVGNTTALKYGEPHAQFNGITNVNF